MKIEREREGKKSYPGFPTKVPVVSFSLLAENIYLGPIVFLPNTLVRLLSTRKTGVPRQAGRQVTQLKSGYGRVP